MKQKMKELWLIVSLLLCCHCIVDATTYSGSCGTNINYSLNTLTGELIITGSGAMKISGTTPPWDSYKSNIKRVYISNGVTSIVSGAFWGCTNLTDITIPSSVNEIGRSAFYYCSALTDVIIPEGVTMIDDFTFYNCINLTSVSIPSSVTSIGQSAFEYCEKLSRFTIPKSVVSIGSRAFAGCANITSINLPVGLTRIESTTFAGCSNVTSLTIPSSVTYIGDYAFSNCSKLTSITIPNSVTSIGSSAFRDCTGLTDVIIGSSVISISSSAFENCTGLTSITIPFSVSNIGSNAFYGCKNLKKVTNESFLRLSKGSGSYGYVAFYADEVIQDDLISYGTCGTNVYYKLKTTGELVIFGNGAMSNYESYNIPWSSNSSQIKKMTISEGVTSIGEYAFYHCSNMTDVTIPASVSSIGSHAFMDCSGILRITVASGNKYYDSRNSCNAIINSSTNQLVVGCSKTFIPTTVASIGDYAFYWCTGLKSITIPNNVMSIGDHAFEGCRGLTSLALRYGISSIGEYAFSGCSGITENIILPGSVTSIGSYAFSSCIGLTSLIIPKSVTSIGSNAFFSCNNVKELTYEDGCKTVLPTGLSNISTVNIPNSVTSIGENAFSGCYGLTSIVIPNNVTTIGKRAFQSCSKLASIIIPQNVTSIGESAFWCCSALTSVTLPDSLRTIGGSAFYECSKLASIDIPDSVKSIGSQAFYNCSGLTSVTVGNGVTSIGWETFKNCTNLASVTIGDGVTTINMDAFSGCSRLSNLKIGNSVTTIGFNAFENCTSLTRIELPGTLTQIDSDAFKGCTSLSYVKCNATTPPVIFYSTFSKYGTLSVPTKAKTAYSGNSYWKKFSIDTFVLKVSEIALSDKTLTLEKGQTETIEAICTPDGADDTSVKWTSSNNNIATVSSDGVVTAVGRGTATITATTQDGTNLSASCEVAVVVPNRLYADSAKSRLHEKAYILPLYMDNRDAISNLQFDVELPEGIDVAYEMNEDEEEDYVITKGERAKTAHTVSVQKNAERNYRVTISSTTNATFKDDDKTLPIAYVKLDYSKVPTVSTADYKIFIKNMVLASDVEGVTTKYTVEADSAVLTIRDAYSVTAVSADNTKGTVSIGGAYESETKDVMNGSIATFTATPKTNMRFAKWTENGEDVSTSNPLTLTINKERNLVAEFAPNKYKITFKVDGEVYSEGLQTYNTTVTTPTNPTKTGYTFAGWNGLTDETKVTADATYEAMFTINSYKVKFIADGKVVSEESLKYGAEITAPTAPLKEGYTFKSWGEVASTVPAQDVTYTAIYEINKYLVRFVANGEDVYNKEQEYGSAITAPDAPEIDGFAFITWGEVAKTVPAHDVEYTAEYVMIGDLVDDGKLNVGDLTKLVDVILRNEGENLDVRNFKKADVLVDNTIDIGDYTRLVGKILDADVAKSKGFGIAYCNPTMQASDIDIDRNGYAMVGLSLTNASAVTAVQFDITATENAEVSLKGMSQHTVVTNMLDSETMRVLVYSATNETIGDAGRINISIADAADELVIKNIVCATPEMTAKTADMNIPLENTATSIGTSRNMSFVVVVDGGVAITSDKSLQIRIHTVDGQLVKTINLNAGETKNVSLATGSYIINGQKYNVK